MHDSEDPADLAESLANEHLPEPLKKNCLVIPKRVLQWSSANLMILGVGIGIPVGAFLTEWVSPTQLCLAFPIALVVARIIRRFILDSEERKFTQAIITRTSKQEG